jgi:hypothetical protein
MLQEDQMRGTFGFGFTVIDASVNPRVHLCADRYTWHDNREKPILNNDLRNEAELDEAIRTLKLDLDEAGRQAKAALKPR